MAWFSAANCGGFIEALSPVSYHSPIVRFSAANCGGFIEAKLETPEGSNDSPFSAANCGGFIEAKEWGDELRELRDVFRRKLRRLH